METLGDVLEAMIREASGDQNCLTIDRLLETAIEMMRAVANAEVSADLALKLGDQLQVGAREQYFPPLLRCAEIVYEEGLSNASLRDNLDLWRRLSTHKANALQRMGYLSGGQDDLRRSVDTYELVLNTLTAEETLARNVVLTNQASARLKLAGLSGAVEHLDEAVTSFQRARAALSDGEPRSHWQRSTKGLADALRQRGVVLAAPADLEGAIDLYDNLLAKPAEDLSGEEQAMVLNGLGVAQFRLSEINGNAELLNRAEANHLNAKRIYERLGPADDLARTFLNLGNVHVRRGERGDPAELRSAISCYEAATARFDPVMFLSDWLDAKTNTGNALLRLGEFVHDIDTMIKGRNQFAEIADLLSPKPSGARWRQNEINATIADQMIARVTGDPDHLLSARERMDVLLNAETSFGSPIELRLALTISGLVEKGLADSSNDPEGYRRAIGRFEPALQSTDPRREPLEFERIATNLGNAQTSLGDILVNPDILRRAISTFDRAVELTDEEGDRIAWAKTQMNRAIAAGILGEYTRRVERLKEAEVGIRNGIRIYSPEEHAGPWAQAQNLLGNTLIRQARLTQDVDLFMQGVDHLRAAKTSSAERGEGLAHATTATNLVSALEEAYDASGDERYLSEAANAAKIAASVFDFVRYPAYAIALRKQLASVLAKMGRLDAAQSQLELLMSAAVDAVLAEPNRSRSNLLLRRASGVADLLAFCQVERGHLRHALASLEAGRGATVRQALRDGVSPETRSAATRWRRTQLTLDALTAIGAPVNAEREKRRETLLAELKAAHDDLRALRATGEQPQRPEELFESLQDALPTGGALVAPVISSVGSAILIVCKTRDDPVLLRMPGLTDRHVDIILGDRMGLPAVPPNRPGWSQAYHEYASTLRRNGGSLDDATARDWRNAVHEILQEIGSCLLSPLHDALVELGLDEGAQIALLAPGRLALLPLGVCPIGDNGALFLDRWSLSVTPSLSSYIESRNQRRGRLGRSRTLVAITDPRRDLNMQASPARCAYPDEAVTDIVGDDADLYTVVEAIGTATDICFFCHGVWSPLDPEDAHLELAQGQRLSVARMRTLDVKEAELAFLAACEAGVIDLHRAPDAFSGLPSSFVEAGFPTVISALWPIPVSATACFVERFFRYYIESGSAAESLRMTQRAFRKLKDSPIQSEASVNFHDADERSMPLKPVHMDLVWMSFSCFGT